MSVVVVTGAGGVLGRRLCVAALDDPSVEQVVALERPGVETLRPADEGGRLLVRRHGDDTASHRRALEGVTPTYLVHLAAEPGPDTDGSGSGGVDLVGTHALLGVLDERRRASGSALEAVVLVSSATVYGAWPDNPVPLTEHAPVRPNPELAFAVDKADLEQRVSGWVANGGAGRLAVLRPALTLSEEQLSWMARSLWQTLGIRTGASAHPVQFVHADDVAKAIDLARRDDLSGVYNVAPDGWVSADDLQELAGTVPRVPLPETAIRRVAELAWRLTLTSTPPGVAVYTRHPWVVSNDRLRRAGWDPTHDNEEAFVVGSSAGSFLSIDARHRQELGLGIIGAALAGAGVGSAVLARRLARSN